MSPDIPSAFDGFLERGCLRPRPAVPWSSFYNARMELLARVEALRTATAMPQAPTYATLADTLGADAADALDILRDAIERGRYPDDTAAHFRLARLRFARWLYRQGYYRDDC